MSGDKWQPVTISTSAYWPKPGVKVTLYHKSSWSRSFIDVNVLADICKCSKKDFPDRHVSPVPVTFKLDPKIKQVIFKGNIRECLKEAMEGEVKAEELNIMIRDFDFQLPEHHSLRPALITLPKKRVDREESSTSLSSSSFVSLDVIRQVEGLLFAHETRMKNFIGSAVGQDVRCTIRQELMAKGEVVQILEEAKREILSRADAEGNLILQSIRAEKEAKLKQIQEEHEAMLKQIQEQKAANLKQIQEEHEASLKRIRLDIEPSILEEVKQQLRNEFKNDPNFQGEVMRETMRKDLQALRQKASTIPDFSFSPEEIQGVVEKVRNF